MPWLSTRKRRRRVGILIAIEGIDQSGKGTQAQLLAKRILDEGYPAEVTGFPNYDTVVGRCLKAYLSGKIDLDSRAAHLLFAANKWESRGGINGKISEGVNLILNRYRASNLAYGVAHGLPVRWLTSLEDGLPATDVVIVLDIPSTVSFERKRRSRDIHEESRHYLSKVRNVYLQLAKRYHWHVIDGGENRESVHSAIWERVSVLLRER